MRSPPFELVRLRLDWPRKDDPPSHRDEPLQIPVEPVGDKDWRAVVDYLLRPEGRGFTDYGELALRAAKQAEPRSPPRIVAQGAEPTSLVPVMIADEVFWTLPCRWYKVRARGKKDKVPGPDTWRRQLPNLSIDGSLTLEGAGGGRSWRLEVKQKDEDFGPEFIPALRDDLRRLLDADWQRHLKDGGLVRAAAAEPSQLERIVDAASDLEEAIAKLLAGPRTRLRTVQSRGGAGARPRLPAAMIAVVQGRPAHNLPTWRAQRSVDIPANRYVRHVAERAARLLGAFADSVEGAQREGRLRWAELARLAKPREKEHVLEALRLDYGRRLEQWRLEQRVKGATEEAEQLKNKLAPSPRQRDSLESQELRLRPRLKLYGRGGLQLWDLDPPIADVSYLAIPDAMRRLLRPVTDSKGDDRSGVEARVQCWLSPLQGDRNRRMYRRVECAEFIERTPIKPPDIDALGRLGRDLKDGRVDLQVFAPQRERDSSPTSVSDSRLRQLRSLSDSLHLLSDRLARRGVGSSPIPPAPTLGTDSRYAAMDIARLSLEAAIAGRSVGDSDIERRAELHRRAQESWKLYESWVGAALLDTLNSIGLVEMEPWSDQLSGTFRGRGNGTTRVAGTVQFVDKEVERSWRLSVWREPSLSPDSPEVVADPRQGWRRPDYVLELHEAGTLKAQLILDAKYKKESGELWADQVVARALYEVFAWEELHREVVKDDAVPDEREDPGVRAFDAKELRDYSQKATRGVVVLHPNEGRAPLSSTPQTWASHSYYGGSTVWQWQRSLTQVALLGTDSPGLLMGMVVCAPDHRGDLRRLLEHWLLEAVLRDSDAEPYRPAEHRLSGLMRWASEFKSRDEREAKKSERPSLQLALPCPRCGTRHLLEDDDHSRAAHRLRCDRDGCDEALEVTYCRHCQSWPLMKRSRVEAMVHDAELKNPSNELVNARCPRCESYL